jgi:hypothetical protein
MKMNYLKLGFAIALTSVIVSGCDDAKTEEAKPQATPVTAPSTYTKKVTIEEFTGAWCGWCVDGHVIVDELMKANTGKIVPIMVHQGDAMQINYFTSFYQSIFKVTGFPTGAVNRIPGTGGGLAVSRTLWSGMTKTELAIPATCGIAMDASSIEVISEKESKIKLKVKVGFGTDITSPLNLTLYLLENKVTGTGSGYDQKNFIANRPGFENHSFFSKPATISNYEHNHVLRAVLSANFGDVIDVKKQVKGGVFEKEYEVNLSGYNTANIEFVALVHRAGSTSDDMAVINAQVVKASENKVWD